MAEYGRDLIRGANLFHTTKIFGTTAGYRVVHSVVNKIVLEPPTTEIVYTYM
jgi:hypothetical protein